MWVVNICRIHSLTLPRNPLISQKFDIFWSLLPCLCGADLVQISLSARVTDVCEIVIMYHDTAL